MASAQQQEQDVIYDRDSQGHVIVDRYAKALEILDGDNPNCWQYIGPETADFSAHFAKLLRDTRLEVSGAQPAMTLSPFVNYKVYLDLKLEDHAVGFNHPIMFEFTDPTGKSSSFSYKLQPGDNMVLVGQFESTPVIGSPNVSVKMSDVVTIIEKQGLLVRRMRVRTA